MSSTSGLFRCEFSVLLRNMRRAAACLSFRVPHGSLAGPFLCCQPLQVRKKGKQPAGAGDLLFALLLYRLKLMQHLSPIELANWTALYLAAGLCCMIAVVLAALVTLADLRRDRAWTSITSWRGAVLFVPRTWWRWQKHYLTSAPVTLAIVGLFASTMRWG